MTTDAASSLLMVGAHALRQTASRAARIGACALCVAALLVPAACAPSGTAVGDTQGRSPSIAHVGTVRDDAVIGVVGSATAAADSVVLDALADAGIEAVYVSVKDSGASGVSDDSAGSGSAGSGSSSSAAGSDSGDGSVASAAAAARAQQGVHDMVSRVVSLIIIADIDVTADADGWNSALRDARNAGIPVALLSPVHAPADERLYAATLTINDRAADATPIDDAAMTILNDEPHTRRITVSTVK
ncbi:hypothetical protein [Bifidobacterium parmae]|uniref:Sugar ABC transporter substrate-binding protein n=1 Tax=Bifidobacterium parmae TaxID=361854 RepID=A0A2N5J332_9BIFI|nr:hypothetical protein [Bifidobacterium parmae]PLS28622.1 sugar ABC transporter substrate-binding protein [Bifidobacterium parmae]